MEHDREAGVPYGVYIEGYTGDHICELYRGYQRDTRSFCYQVFVGLARGVGRAVDR